MEHIEPDLKYCLGCEDEYRAEIEHCAGCGAVLITGQELMDRLAARQEQQSAHDLELGPDNDLVTVQRGSLADLKSLEELLRSQGVAALIAGDENSCGKGCCSPAFFLQVRQGQLQETVTLLEHHFRNSTGLGEHDTSHSNGLFDERVAMATCPACGFSFATTTTTCPDCGLCFG